MTKHTGTCHCGAVQFEVEAELAEVSRCNCTICAKTAWAGVIVKPAAFCLVSGASELAAYEWGHKVSKRYFCKRCGVQCYGAGHLDVLGGDFVSINVNALDGVELGNLRVRYFDGRHNNWQAGTRETAWPIYPA